MTTTSGRFDLTAWDEEVYDDGEGARLQRVHNTKSFSGGITGTGDARLLQALAQQGSAAYVGIERVTADVDGHTGTFVLRHSAVGNAAGGVATIDVVPDSGTGELSRLRGTMSIVRSAEGEHTYTFDYEV